MQLTPLFGTIFLWKEKVSQRDVGPGGGGGWNRLGKGIAPLGLFVRLGRDGAGLSWLGFALCPGGTSLEISPDWPTRLSRVASDLLSQKGRPLFSVGGGVEGLGGEGLGMVPKPCESTPSFGTRMGIATT